MQTRWKEHLRHSKYGNQVINRAMKKHGVDKFYIECLESCLIEDIDNREIYYISLFQSTDKLKGYNVSLGDETPKFQRKELDIQTMVQLYIKDDWTLDRIAKRFSVTRYIVTTELRNIGVQIKPNGHYPTINNVSRESLMKALKENNSLRKAAQVLNLSYSFFRKACIYYNIEYNSSTSARHPVMEDDNIC